MEEENLDSSSDEGAKLTMRNHEATGEVRNSAVEEVPLSIELHDENSVVYAEPEAEQ